MKPMTDTRTRYPLRPHIVLDLRHYGGIEFAVDRHYEAFLRQVAKAQSAAENDLELDYHGAASEILGPISRRIWRASKTGGLHSILAAQKAWKRFLVAGRDTISATLCASMPGAWEDTYGARRLGTGDLLIEASVINRVADHVGRDNLLVLYDPLYPAAKQIWGGMSPEIRSTALGAHDPISAELIRDSTGNWTDYTVISSRGHPQESHLGGSPGYSYAQRVGFPGAQMLYELGWETQVSWNPVEIPLQAPPGANEQAQQVLSSLNLQPGEYACVQPIERTRENRFSTPAAWKRGTSALEESYGILPCLCGAASDERETAAAFLDVRLVDKVSLFIAPLLIGGRGAVPAVGGSGVERVADALRLERVTTDWCGPDLLYTGYPLKDTP